MLFADLDFQGVRSGRREWRDVQRVWRPEPLSHNVTVYHNGRGISNVVQVEDQRIVSFVQIKRSLVSQCARIERIVHLEPERVHLIRLNGAYVLSFSLTWNCPTNLRGSLRRVGEMTLKWFIPCFRRWPTLACTSWKSVR